MKQSMPPASKTAFVLPISHFAVIGLLLSIGCGCSGLDTDPTNNLETARSHIRISDFSGASDILESFLARTQPQESQLVEAHYLAGIAAWHRVPSTQQWEEGATAHLTTVVQFETNHPYQPHAAYTLGRIAEVIDYPSDTPKIEQARDWYEKTIALWPESQAAHFATFRLAAIQINTFQDSEQVRQGTTLLEEWFEQHPEHELAPVAASFLARSYDLVLNDVSQALEWYLKGESLGWVTQTKISDYRWRIAQLAEQTDQPRRAVEMYQKIIRENYIQGRAYISQLRLQELTKQYPEIEIQIPEVPLLGDHGSRE
jgi:outer membrane protein assembly factor BamD (BamD/ComL family)